jgi:hypothetical protein
MSDRFKLIVGWVCFRIVLAVPLRWIRPDSPLIAWAGYYAYRPN